MACGVWWLRREETIRWSVPYERGRTVPFSCKQRLPFSDNSFDLVRMSCLALCITSDSWVFVLQEVSRVLIAGGRLELIDDLIFFPYGKSCSMMGGVDVESSQISSVPPKLDISHLTNVEKEAKKMRDVLVVLEHLGGHDATLVP